MKIAVTVGFDGVVGVDNIFIVVVDIFVLVAVAVLEFVGRRGVDHARRGLPMVVAVGQPQKFVRRPERADSLCILHFESVCIGGFGRQCDRPAQTAAHDVERRGAVQQRRVVHEIGRDHRKSVMPSIGELIRMPFHITCVCDAAVPRNATVESVARPYCLMKIAVLNVSTSAIDRAMFSCRTRVSSCVFVRRSLSSDEFL